MVVIRNIHVTDLLELECATLATADAFAGKYSTGLWSIIRHLQEIRSTDIVCIICMLSINHLRWLRSYSCIGKMRPQHRTVVAQEESVVVKSFDGGAPIVFACGTDSEQNCGGS